MTGTAHARLAVWVVSVAFLAACSSTSDTGEACDCPGSGLTLNIPFDIAPSVSSVQVSGSACTGVTATCTNQSGGCSQYSIEPATTGVCHVEVDSAGGVFAADVTITQAGGCCTGLVASPVSAATLDVPESDGGGN